MFDLNIIIPVYNDWESVALLVDKIKLNVNQSYKVIIVNDFSSLKCPVSLVENPDIIILNLIRNLGHQRAICVGLSYVYENFPGSSVVIMDGDGEDRPEDIRLLIQDGTEKGCVSFAKRTNRLEGKIFGILYSLYKRMFRLLTGQNINFGNYSYIPSGYLKNVVYLSEIWNNYPAGVIFAKLPVSTVPIAKGTRLAGKSKMNHYSLIHHGLSAISVYIENILVRLLVFSLVVLFLLLIIALVVVFLKIFTTLTSPGWATTIVFGCLTLSFQILVMLVFFVFITLSNRSNVKIIPICEYKKYL